MITQVMIGWLITFISGALVWMILEKQSPLREINYAQQLFKELGAALISIPFFGTYLNPDTVDPDGQNFGIVDQQISWQKVVGI